MMLRPGAERAVLAGLLAVFVCRAVVASAVGGLTDTVVVTDTRTVTDVRTETLPPVTVTEIITVTLPSPP